MNPDPQSLFRNEVLAARSDMASGTSIDIRPISAGRMTLFFLVLLLVILLVLVFGTYSKKERVTGIVQPTAGVAVVVSPESGDIKRVLVKESQSVKAGELIAEISNERFSDVGNTQVLLEKNLEGQHEQVRTQSEGQFEANAAILASLDERIAQGLRDLGTLREEVRLQEQQVAMSGDSLEKLRPLLAEHIVSETQYEQESQALRTQAGRALVLRRQLSATQAELDKAKDERTRQTAQHRIDRARLGRDLLNLQRDQVQRHSNRVILLRAPIDGVVSGLQATSGKAVSINEQLASIVPMTSSMQAILHVPSTAIGFIKVGQGVRIAYDAFPYQRFGQYHGVVTTVSQTDVPRALLGTTGFAAGDRRAMFVVRVALDKSSVKAYNVEIALRAGQTLTADVELDRRTLMRWMLDPLFAFSGKL